MPKSKHKKTKLLGRIILIIIVVGIAVLLILTGLFKYYKDDIGRSVLLRVNNIQSGELSFEDIAFNPFKHFPSISIELNEVGYYEHKEEVRSIDTLPIVQLENLYISFDVIDLVKGNVNVSQIILENGQVNLITYADSTFNLTNALLHQDTLVNKIDTTKQVVENFDVDLKRIALSGIKVSYNNIPNNTNSSYTINTLDASLNIQDEKINSKTNTQFNINKINQTGGFLLSNKQVKIESSLIFDRNANTIQIESSKLMFDKANFSIDGKLDLNQKGLIDVTVKGNDKDFSVLSLFLSEAGINNIKGGNLFFNGIIIGQLFDEIPMIDFSFGMKDVEIQIPNTKEKITQLNLNGTFKSGEKKDLSDASLNIKDLTAKLPGGNMDGHFSIENFTNPILDIEFKMKADVYGFDKIFNIKMIDSLSGKMEIGAKYIGIFDLSSKTIIEKTDSAMISFENLSFVIPDVNQVRNINGLIQLKNDTAFFNSLELEIGTSDFNINGSLTNLFSLFINVDKNIEGDLQILSNTYDFPDFFKYDLNVANSFPYRIKDVNLNVNVLTSAMDLTEFVVTPHIVFDIKLLEADIEDFLPPVKISYGVFTLGLPFDSAQGDSSLNLNFSDFEIEMAGSNLLTNVVFNSPKIDPNWLTVDLKAANLNPQKTFVYWTQDSIPNYLNGILDGSMHLDLVFSKDSVVFEKLDFNAERLGVANAKDTFDLRDLSLNAKGVNYNISDSTELMQTLSFKTELKVKNAYTNNFNADNLDYEIEANKGEYRIKLNNSQFFDKVGEGYIVASPFEKTPRYKFNYKVQQFDVAQMFTTFKEDTLINGKMDMDIEITFSGNEGKEIMQSINGRILLNGKDLTLYGLDMDKVIERFKRSQKFTLADVGAVVLMGPAGLLVTKGSDFASLVVLNPGEISEVAELSSDWEFNNGVMNLADVAFTTQENRMAFKGSVDFLTDSVAIEIALLNELGCSLYSQDIFGTLDSLEFSKVKVMKSLLAPVTNLVTSEKKCDVFYNGKVKQPEKEK